MSLKLSLLQEFIRFNLFSTGYGKTIINSLDVSKNIDENEEEYNDSLKETFSQHALKILEGRPRKDIGLTDESLEEFVDEFGVAETAKLTGQNPALIKKRYDMIKLNHMHAVSDLDDQEMNKLSNDPALGLDVDERIAKRFGHHSSAARAARKKMGYPPAPEWMQNQPGRKGVDWTQVPFESLTNLQIVEFIKNNQDLNISQSAVQYMRNKLGIPAPRKNRMY